MKLKYVLMKKLEIQANFKVNFLRRNAEMTRIKIFLGFFKV